MHGFANSRQAGECGHVRATEVEVMSWNRSTAVSLVSAVAFVAVGVWGVVNLSEGDWFIGCGMLGSAVIALSSLATRMLQDRRRA